MSDFAPKTAQRQQTTSSDADPDVKPHEPRGLEALERLAQGGRPSPQEVAELLAAHPGETEVMVAFVQRRFGNAFTDEVLAKPVSVDLGAAARELVETGISDENKLTNELFWRRYPGLRDRRLTPGTQLAKQWLEIRDDVAREAITRSKPTQTVAVAAPQVAAPQVAAPQVAAVEQRETAEPRAEPEEQEHEEDASAPLAETHVATPAPATAPGPQKTKPAASTIRTTKEEAGVLNAIRGQSKRLDPTWLRAVQLALGVANASGAMNTETLRAFRRETGNAKLGAKEIFDPDFLADKAPGPHFFTAGEMTKVKANKNDTSEDQKAYLDRASRLGGAADYAAWQGAWVSLTLLGKTLGQGHPIIAGKLQAADAYLKGRFPGKSLDEIRVEIGWNGQGNGAYYALGAHYHSMGLAIDIEPAQNPYIFRGKGGKKDTADDFYEKLFVIATNVYGGEPITAKLLGEWSQELSTEELWAKIHATSDAVGKYLDLTKADTETFVQALVASKKYTDDEARKIAQRRKNHWDWFHDAGRNQTKAKSITNISEELVIALRDVAGLAWGAGEFTRSEGGVNGDFMHFDCRTDPVGKAMLGTLAEAQRANDGG